MGMSGNFLVLGTGRSGTSWLIDTLSRHPDLVAHDEMFNLGMEAPARANNYFMLSGERNRYPRPISVWKFLARHFRGVERAGFKMLYGDLRQFPDVIGCLILMRFGVIHIIRQNQLDATISLEIVHQRLPKWHLREGEANPADDLSIVLPAKTLVRELDEKYKRIAQARRFLRVARLPHIELEYEILKADPGEFARVWEFLGVASPPAGPVSTLRKIRTQSHREILQNYAEVQAALAGSAYEHLLEK